jgi:hypothetical protein
VKLAAAIIALIGLLLQLRGGYIASSMFQPFPFLDFLKHVPRILCASLLGFRPDWVLSHSYRATVGMRRKLLEEQGHDAAYFIAGLGLMVVGFALQVVAGLMVLWTDLQT